MDIIKYCLKEKLFFTITNLCDRLSLNKNVLILEVGHADNGTKFLLAATIKGIYNKCLWYYSDE